MKKVLSFVAVATLFLVSCQREIAPIEQTNQNGSFTIKASVEEFSSPTKAVMDDSFNLLWSAGDKIAVHASTWADEPFTLVGDGGKSSGDFTWDNGTEFSPNAIAAFFPYGGGNNYSEGTSSAYFTLPYSYDGYTSGKMLTPLVATMANSSDAISFKHAAAAVKVTIENLPAGAKSIGMSVAGQQINGYYNIPRSSFGTAIIEKNSGSSAVNTGDPNSIWLNFPALDAEQAFTFIFPVPALTKPQLTFAVYDENNIEVWSKKVKAQANDLGRGDVLNMPALTITPYAKFNTVSTYYVHGTLSGSNFEYADFAMYTDGSKSIAKGLQFAAGGKFTVTDGNVYIPEGYGNDWVITDAGTYDIIFDPSGSTTADKIKVVPSKCAYPKAPHHSSITSATNLGATETANCYVITAAGSYKIPVVKGNSSDSAGKRAISVLLWETKNNAEDVERNSIIEAVDYDDDDNFVYFKTPSTLVPGNALIAAKNAAGEIIWSWHIWIPKTTITDIGEYAASTKYYMDRNLGALVATEASTSSSVDVQSFGMFYQWGRKDPFTGAKAFNSGERAQLAGTAQTRTSETTFTLADTYANPTVYANYSGWLSTETAWTASDGKKSISDPCPAGYRVPVYNSSEKLLTNATSATGFVANDTYGWWKIGNHVFPMAGYLESGNSVAHAYDRSRIWTATYYSSNTEYARNMYYYISSGVWNFDSSARKNYGLSVRCQKIAGEVPEPEVVYTGATSIDLDGQFTDWATADVLGSKGSVKEWKYGSDTKNIYFYFKISRSDVKAASSEPFIYNWRRYLAFQIDTNNNSGNGSTPNYAGMSLAGCEAWGMLYPFRGTATVADGTDGDLQIVNGVDGQGGVSVISGLVSAPESESGKVGITAYGSIDSDYVYVEMGFPRTAIGSPSSEKIKVQFSFSWTCPDARVITIN